MSNPNVEELVETLSGLTVLDMSKLKAALEEKWGVKAAAAAPMMVAAPGAGEGAEAAAESTEFTVILDGYPAEKKISIIKVVRAVTGLGLKEAKDLCESAPKAIKESTSKADAEEISKKITDAGGKVTLKGL